MTELSTTRLERAHGLRKTKPHCGTELTRSAVALYFFDFKSVDAFSRDFEGMELPAEAAHGIAMPLLTLPATIIEGSLDQHFAVEVRNGTVRVLEVTAVFNSRFSERNSWYYLAGITILCRIWKCSRLKTAFSSRP
jgi:hypothetical protein